MPDITNNSDIPPEDLAYLQQVQSLANHPVFKQASQMGVPVTPDLLEKLAIEQSKHQAFSKGIVTVDAPTGGKINVDAATREIIDPNKIVKLPGSQGVSQEQLPDGTYLLRDRVTGEKVTGERPPTPTEAQGNALMFSNRMKEANDIVSGVNPEHYNPTAFMDTFSAMPNRLKSEERQKYQSAAANWISAALRKESGAAISQSEYEEGFKQYFPLPGDKPAVVDQKAKLRSKVAEDMSSLAGPFAHQQQQQQAASSSAPAAPASATATTGHAIGSVGTFNGRRVRKTANGWVPF